VWWMNGFNGLWNGDMVSCSMVVCLGLMLLMFVVVMYE